jgi:hypothetical protein
MIKCCDPPLRNRPCRVNLRLSVGIIREQYGTIKVSIRFFPSLKRRFLHTKLLKMSDLEFSQRGGQRFDPAHPQIAIRKIQELL